MSVQSSEREGEGAGGVSSGVECHSLTRLDRVGSCEKEWLQKDCRAVAEWCEIEKNGKVRVRKIQVN